MISVRRDEPAEPVALEAPGHTDRSAFRCVDPHETECAERGARSYLSWFGAKLTGKGIFDRFWEIAEQVGVSVPAGFLQTIAVAETDELDQTLAGVQTFRPPRPGSARSALLAGIVDDVDGAHDVRLHLRAGRRLITTMQGRPDAFVVVVALVQGRAQRVR